MSDDLLKPGEIAPESGQYEVVGPRGGSKNREVTSVKGKKLPPTQNPNEKYRLVDPTKHKNNK
ncbi:MAG: YjzC family protein [Bacillales bacterium]|nr:YjzC family protein [Bacillales bacterium]